MRGNQMNKKVMFLTTDEYDWYGEDKGWDTEVIYKDEMGMPFDYFYSPDGIGRIWHNTLQEIYDNVFVVGTPIIVVRQKGKYE
jgi:hypothetical protein